MEAGNWRPSVTILEDGKPRQGEDDGLTRLLLLLLKEVAIKEFSAFLCFCIARMQSYSSLRHRSIS